MEGKTVKETAVVLSQLMGPQDTNNAGNVHGGVVMKLIDSTAAVVATRHARSTCVTASIDRLDFIYPVYTGDLVTFKASLNYVGKKSMEIGVRVDTENLISGEKKHTASAYLTFVSLDKSGRTRELPPLIMETETEKRRNLEAQSRREVRLKERLKEKEKSDD